MIYILRYVDFFVREYWHFMGKLFIRDIATDCIGIVQVIIKDTDFITLGTCI